MSENYHENHFVSSTWGVLDFFPTKGDAYKDTCKHCILLHSEECKDAHCTAQLRADGKQGYFSIHQMPKERKTLNQK